MNDKTKKTLLRVISEYNKISNDEDINNSFGIDYWDNDESNKYHWEVTLIPPAGTLYEGGYYRLEVLFPNDYPDSPPKVKFLTKIYHCNISSYTGYICLNTLEKSSWKSDYSMEDIFNHIIILLFTPNSEDPIFDSVGCEYKNNKNDYELKAKDWVKKYANADDFCDESKQGIKPGFYS